MLIACRARGPAPLLILSDECSRGVLQLVRALSSSASARRFRAADPAQFVAALLLSTRRLFSSLRSEGSPWRACSAASMAFCSSDLACRDFLVPSMKRSRAASVSKPSCTSSASRRIRTFCRASACSARNLEELRRAFGRKPWRLQDGESPCSPVRHLVICASSR